MFSVVIPLYNKEKYILRAVESVLAQTYKDFELIVVDDGSTDNSLISIKDISDSRIRVIKQANQGVGAARNKGMTESHYKWIALLDADDAWSTNHLSELFNIIKEFPDSGIVSTKILELQDGKELSAVDEYKSSSIRSVNYFFEASKKISVIHSSSVAIKKEVFNEIGGFSNKKMGEDLEYWVKISLSYPVAISDKATSYYFRGTNGAMDSQETVKKAKEFLTLNDISPSINLIVNESKLKPSILKQKNIRRYINSRLYNGIKQSLYRGDIVSAKKISKLALPQADKIYIFALAISVAPKVTLEKSIKSYKRIK